MLINIIKVIKTIAWRHTQTSISQVTLDSAHFVRWSIVWYLVNGFPQKNKVNLIANWWSFRCLIIALGLMVIFSTIRQNSLVPPNALHNIQFPLLCHSDCSPPQCKWQLSLVFKGWEFNWVLFCLLITEGRWSDLLFGNKRASSCPSSSELITALTQWSWGHVPRSSFDYCFYGSEKNSMLSLSNLFLLDMCYYFLFQDILDSCLQMLPSPLNIVTFASVASRYCLTLMSAWWKNGIEGGQNPMGSHKPGSSINVTCPVNSLHTNVLSFSWRRVFPTSWSVGLTKLVF